MYNTFIQLISIFAKVKNGVTEKSLLPQRHDDMRYILTVLSVIIVHR